MHFSFVGIIYLFPLADDISIYENVTEEKELS